MKKNYDRIKHKLLQKDDFCKEYSVFYLFYSQQDCLFGIHSENF